MMHLSKRLKRVAEQITDARTVADIGCDHAFTSIYLVRTGRTKKAIAMDIGRQPLLRAKEHIQMYQMQDCIEVRRSDGAKGLKRGEADVILISGMGGNLICRILNESAEKMKDAEQLVLSPQSDIPRVRKQIHALGFCIQKEEMVLDQNKYYVILSAVPGEEAYEQPEEYKYGKCLIEGQDPVFYEYLKKQYSQMDRVIASMEKSRLSEKSREHLEKQKKEQKQMIQILERYGDIYGEESESNSRKRSKGV